MQKSKDEEEILIFNKLDAESEVISSTLKRLESTGGRALKKDVILSLIAEMESTSDVVRLNVLRGALQIVVGCSRDGESE